MITAFYEKFIPKMPVIRSFGGLCVIILNELLNKQSSRSRSEQPWRSCDVIIIGISRQMIDDTRFCGWSLYVYK